jgi:hypothetical protein
MMGCASAVGWASIDRVEVDGFFQLTLHLMSVCLLKVTPSLLLGRFVAVSLE